MRTSILAALAMAGSVTAQHINFARFDLAVADAPSGLAVGDFTGDGRVDLAVACTGTDRAYVLKGLGGGGFAAPVLVGPAAADPNGLVAADLDGDGRLDLATAGSPGIVQVLLQGPGGAFTAVAPGASGASTASWIASGDFDGDGLADLTTSNGLANSQSTLLSLGGGALAAPAIHGPTAQSNRHCAVADLERDGDLDVATASAAFGATVLPTLIGDGSGAFSSTGLPGLHSGTFQEKLVFGEFTGDGILDLVESFHYSLDHELYHYQGTGSGFSGGTPTLLDPQLPALADLNGDGLADMIAVMFQLGPGPKTVYTVLADDTGGFGGGFFGAYLQMTVSGGGSDIATADFDGDGLLDFAIAAELADEISLFLQRPVAPPVVTGTSPVVVPKIFFAGTKLSVYGKGFTSMHSLSIGTKTWFSDLSKDDETIEFVLTTPPPGGPIEQLTVTNAFGSASMPVLVGPLSGPALVLQNAADLHGTADLALGSKPGDIVFLGASPDLVPSSLPGLVDLAIGNGFVSLYYLGSALIPPDGGVAKHIALGALPVGFTVHFQLAALAPVPVFPLAVSNVASGTVQ